MIYFRGTIDGNQNATVLKNGKPMNLHLNLWNHSPTGFSWGYYGSGPTQLSLCILYEFAKDTGIMNPKEFAETHMYKFKEDLISKIPMDAEWCMWDDAIVNWLGNGEFLISVGNPYSIS